MSVNLEFHKWREEKVVPIFHSSVQMGVTLELITKKKTSVLYLTLNIFSDTFGKEGVCVIVVQGSFLPVINTILIHITIAHSAHLCIVQSTRPYKNVLDEDCWGKS